MFSDLSPVQNLFLVILAVVDIAGIILMVRRDSARALREDKKVLSMARDYDRVISIRRVPFDARRDRILLAKSKR